MNSPKFKIGDRVSCPKTLYNEYEGEIIEIDKVFQDINPDGTFDRDGLAILESTISFCKIPYEFDGETLKVHYPSSDIKLKDGFIHENAKTRISKFSGYAYTVKSTKMSSVFSERNLSLYL